MAPELLLWDPLRWYLIITSLVFGLVTGPCIAWAPSWDQKFRFVALLGYDTLVASLMFLGIGKAYAWYHWGIALNGLVAELGVAMFLWKMRKDSRASGTAERGEK